jgi:Uma2 family endonuclease
MELGDTLKQMANPTLSVSEVEAADQIGIKLEMTEGLPTWEFHPTLNHQIVTQAVIRSVRSTNQESKGACLPVPDVLIRFPDGSLKRPDISIFCEMPSERDQVVSSIPGAVVEVISADSWKKDLELNPPFYLKHGVRDVVVIDPTSHQAMRFTRDGRSDLKLPNRIDLQCGCTIEV